MVGPISRRAADQCLFPITYRYVFHRIQIHLFLTLLPQNHNVLIIQKLVPTRSVRVFDMRKLDQKELI